MTDLEFWREVRRGLLTVVRAIEARYPELAPAPKDYKPRACPDLILQQSVTAVVSPPLDLTREM